MFDWIASQSLDEQMDILDEYRQLIAELLSGDPNPEHRQLLVELAAGVDRYKESILNEKIAKLKYEAAERDMERAVKKMDDTWIGVRNYIIECIVTNADNAEAMRGLAEKVIALEKDSGKYDPDNWKAIR